MCVFKNVIAGTTLLGINTYFNHNEIINLHYKIIFDMIKSNIQSIIIRSMGMREL